MVDANGKSDVDREDAKIKGEVVVGGIPSKDIIESSYQNFLMTLDIFVGCGVLSHRLQQSCTYGSLIIHAHFKHTLCIPYRKN